MLFLVKLLLAYGFFTFYELCKWYQIAHCITYSDDDDDDDDDGDDDDDDLLLWYG